MDGFEVLQCIKCNPSERSYRLGANGYIVKPLDFGRFIEMVQILCNYWLTHNRAVENSVRA
jgi:AmiR/NasT family two-component response regulator